ncbi:metal ABC transporter ATP-binding protein [Patescibacteria group bacterium]|nr:metal ABC transporter ATP-binding protein [Patescibacteria group bacterium]
MNKILLEVKNLNVVLDNERIIENLSFQAVEGEILTILGPNGAGKSVLLRTLLGFLPYEGSIVWNQKLKVGYLPQGLNQLKVKDLPLTVWDFFVLKNPIPKKDEIIQFLNLVGLEKEILYKVAGHLSGGQFQRMLVAWVLISHPHILFFDEPTTGIDIGGGETIYSLLHTISKKENLTLFLVTHDLNIVYKYSNNVLCLNRKGHSCLGSPKEILSPENLEQLFGTEIKFYEHH